MRATADPSVVIEDEGAGWVRYRASDGRRWEVWGVCDRRGDCLVGSVIDGEQVRDLAHLAELGDRPDSELDVPVAPGLSGCCPFRFVSLP